VESDIAYFVTYPCPRCKAELESQHGGWDGWLRCPACGTPALPPEILLGHPTTRRRVKELDGDDVLIITDDGYSRDGAAAVDPAALIGPPVSPAVSAMRLVFLTGLVISLFLLLIAYLDQNQRVTTVAGSLSIIFFLLLLRMPGRRRSKG
jgi:DNA-directed RNA polymerase subunit RPC12/RpoP